MEHKIVTDRCAQMRREARQALKGRWGNVVLATFLYMAITGGGSYVMQWIFGDNIGPLLSAIYGLLVGGPMSFGYLFYIRKISANQAPALSELFAGFEKIWKLVRLILLIYAVIIGAFIIFVIIVTLIGGFSLLSLAGGINAFASVGNAVLIIVLLGLFYIALYFYAALMYNQVYVVMMDEPDIGVIKALRQSRIRMKDNKGKLFLLMLSFIGWIIVPFILFTFAGIQMTSITLATGIYATAFPFNTFALIVSFCYILFLAPYITTAYMVFSNKLAGTDGCFGKIGENGEEVDFGLKQADETDAGLKHADEADFGFENTKEAENNSLEQEKPLLPNDKED